LGEYTLKADIRFKKIKRSTFFNTDGDGCPKFTSEATGAYNFNDENASNYIKWNIVTVIDGLEQTVLSVSTFGCSEDDIWNHLEQCNYATKKTVYDFLFPNGRA
jgi:hypothetical protein